AKTVRLEYLNKRHLAGKGPGPTFLTYFVELVGNDTDQYTWVSAKDGKIQLSFSQRPAVKSRQIYDAANGPPLGTLTRREGQAATGNVDVDKAYDYAGYWYDYFSTNFGRDSYNNLGAPLVFSVRACPSSPCPWPNAGWNPQAQQMWVGTGFGSADDVIAHELT